MITRDQAHPVPGGRVPLPVLQEQQQSLKSAGMAGCKLSLKGTCHLSATLLKGERMSPVK